MLLVFFSVLLSVALASRSIEGPRQAESSHGSDKYIIKFKSDVTTTAVADLKALLISTPTHEYSMPGFHGFASALTTEELAHLHHSDQVRHRNPFAMPY
jgi:cerevisin